MNFDLLISIKNEILSYFVSEKIDRIDIITTHFNNMMSYNIVDWEILPIKIEKADSYCCNAKYISPRINTSSCISFPSSVNLIVSLQRLAAYLTEVISTSLAAGIGSAIGFLIASIVAKVKQ